MKWQFVLLCVISMVYCLFTMKLGVNKLPKRFSERTNGLISTSTNLTLAQDPSNGCPVCQCGVPRSDGRLIDEQKEKKVYPWYASLLYNKNFYCQATLINDLYLITAARCTSGFSPENITVRYQQYEDLMNETKTTDLKVAKYFPHFLYNPGTYENDIALLKLTQKVNFSDEYIENDDDLGLRPVCLPNSSLSYDNFSAIGSENVTEEDVSVFDAFHETNASIISNAECRQSYKLITDNMVCAVEGSMDTFQMLGGPLQVLDITSQQMQAIGVMSWGEDNASSDTPRVYTRLDRYLDWIRSNTRDACYC